MAKKTAKRYWLMKSEPETYSIENLARDTTTAWGCVRNYQARNFMLHEMKLSDQVLFYHSNSEPSGIAGLAQVASLAKPDKTQFDKKSDYFDPKATLTAPRWFCVDVSFVQKFPQILSLNELRSKKELKDMLLLKRGQRLSIQPVAEAEFEYILKMTKS